MLALVPGLENWPKEKIAARVKEMLQLVGLAPEEFAGGGRENFPAGSGRGWEWRGRWRRIRRFC